MKASSSNPPEHKSTRREMIRQSGTVLAASALANVTIPLAHAGENNTIKLALVGCGGRGTGAVADAFSTTGGPVQLYAMADLFEDRLQGQPQQPDRRVQGQGERGPRALFPRVRCLQEGDRLPRAGRRRAADDPLRLPADDVRVRGFEGRERLHGEILRRRCPQHAAAAQGRRGVGEEEPQGRRRLHVASLAGARRSSSAFTTARSATSTPCASTASMARSTARR